MFSGGDPNHDFHNGNIIGTLYRAVRMIYYAREDLVRGASAWSMFGNEDVAGFATLPPDAPSKRFLSYWLYYYFDRHVAANVLDMNGAAPVYTPSSGVRDVLPGPLTPALATIEKDGNTIYLVIVNGSWDQSVPCSVRVANFAIANAEGVYLSQDDRNARPLLASKADAVRDLPVTVASGCVTCTLAPHSADFITLTKKQ